MGKFFRLYGRNSIYERLKTNAQSIKQVIVEKNHEFSECERICKSKGIPLRYLTDREFQKITRNIRAQGIIAEVEDFRYSSFENIVSLPKDELPTLIFLDSLNDPQNLGSIVRTSACFGTFALILPKHDSVEVTEAVLRVASGGESYVAIAQVTNLSLAITQAKQSGYWIAGAVVEGGEPLTKINFSFPLGLVIGSEAKGIRQGLLKQLDFRFTIPTQGARLSFNVASATAIFCYEATRQRK